MSLDDIQKQSHLGSYGLFMLRGRLDYIRASNPKIYRIYDEKCEFKTEVGEFYQDEIDKARIKGLKVELQDNSNLIKELESAIKSLEERINE